MSSPSINLALLCCFAGSFLIRQQQERLLPWQQSHDYISQVLANTDRWPVHV